MSDINNKLFKEQFMEVQLGLVSLCMELVGDIADKIYIYCSIERETRMFNVFFKVDNEIKTLNLLGLDSTQSTQLLRSGTFDLLKLEKVCKEFNMSVPTEIKMIYDVKSEKFDTKYRYDEVCSAKTGKAQAQVFMEWIAEIKQG